MAGYAFSHQFYQHWSQAPAQVRGAIVQDLKDIMTLLQTDTTVAEFAFTQPDLDRYLDEVYAQDRMQKAADAEKIRLTQEQERIERETLEAQRQEEERLEKAQLEQEQLEQERLELARLEEEQAKQDAYEKAEQQRAEQQQAEQAEAEQQAAIITNEQDLAADVEETTTSTTATLTIVPQLDEEALTTATSTEPTATPDISAPTREEGIAQENIDQEFLSHEKSAPAEIIALSQEQEDFVHELEVRIDDYLSEQMANMSENLKAWLRDEVQRQLARTK